jgi:hypothetical protein
VIDREKERLEVDFADFAICLTNPVVLRGRFFHFTDCRRCTKRQEKPFVHSNRGDLRPMAAQSNFPRIAGVVVLVLLGAGLLIRVTNYSGGPPQEPRRASVEIPPQGSPLDTETVDPKTGNLHLTVPIRASTKKQ